MAEQTQANRSPFQSEGSLCVCEISLDTLSTSSPPFYKLLCTNWRRGHIRNVSPDDDLSDYPILLQIPSKSRLPMAIMVTQAMRHELAHLKMCKRIQCSTLLRNQSSQALAGRSTWPADSVVCMLFNLQGVSCDHLLVSPIKGENSERISDGCRSGQLLVTWPVTAKFRALKLIPKSSKCTWA